MHNAGFMRYANPSANLCGNLNHLGNGIAPEASRSRIESPSTSSMAM
jgi:hypothetical protein